MSRSFWARAAPLAILALLTWLNVQPRPTTYPELLSGIIDAPWTHPALLDDLLSEKYHGVQYGWPFNAYEMWWKVDRPAWTNSDLLNGSFLNCLVALVLCGFGYLLGMRWDRRPPLQDMAS